MGCCPNRSAVPSADPTNVPHARGRQRAAIFSAALASTAGVLLGLAVSPTATAATPRGFTVAPGESIQRAIDAAAPGSTITIAPGVYAESLVVYKAGLTLRARGVTLRPKVTVGAPFGVCVSHSPSCLSFFDTPVVGVTVDGLTVDGAPGDGFLAYKSTQTSFVNDVAVHSAHTGFAVVQSSEVALTNDRAEASDDSGFTIEGSAGVRLTSAHATSNHTFGVGVVGSSDTSVVSANATGNCAGVAVAYSAGVDVENGAFPANTRPCPALTSIPATSGVGVLVNSSSAVRVAGNIVSGNGSANPAMLSAGLAVIRSVPGSANVFTANSALNNRAVDIRTDDTDPETNRFTANTCRTSAPAGLC